MVAAHEKAPARPRHLTGAESAPTERPQTRDARDMENPEMPHRLFSVSPNPVQAAVGFIVGGAASLVGTITSDDAMKWLPFIGGVLSILSGVVVGAYLKIAEYWRKAANAKAEERYAEAEKRYQDTLKQVNDLAAKLKESEEDRAELRKDSADNLALAKANEARIDALLKITARGESSQ